MPTTDEYVNVIHNIIVNTDQAEQGYKNLANVIRVSDQAMIESQRKRVDAQKKADDSIAKSHKGVSDAEKELMKSMEDFSKMSGKQLLELMKTSDRARAKIEQNNQLIARALQAYSSLSEEEKKKFKERSEQKIQQSAKERKAITGDIEKIVQAEQDRIKKQREQNLLPDTGGSIVDRGGVFGQLFDRIKNSGPAQFVGNKFSQIGDFIERTTGMSDKIRSLRSVFTRSMGAMARAAGPLLGALGGVATAMAGVVAIPIREFLTKTQEGMDLMRVRSAQLRGALQPLRERIQDLGSDLVNLDFKSAGEKIKEFLQLLSPTPGGAAARARLAAESKIEAEREKIREETLIQLEKLELEYRNKNLAKIRRQYELEKTLAKENENDLNALTASQLQERENAINELAAIRKAAIQNQIESLETQISVIEERPTFLLREMQTQVVGMKEKVEQLKVEWMKVGDEQEKQQNALKKQNLQLAFRLVNDAVDIVNLQKNLTEGAIFAAETLPELARRALDHAREIEMLQTELSLREEIGDTTLLNLRLQQADLASLLETEEKKLATLMKGTEAWYEQMKAIDGTKRSLTDVNEQIFEYGINKASVIYLLESEYKLRQELADITDASDDPERQIERERINSLLSAEIKVNEVERFLEDQRIKQKAVEEEIERLKNLDDQNEKVSQQIEEQRLKWLQLAIAIDTATRSLIWFTGKRDNLKYQFDDSFGPKDTRGFLEKFLGIPEDLADEVERVINTANESLKSSVLESIRQEREDADFQIQIQEGRVERALEIAEKGNVALVEMEEERLDRLYQAKASAMQKERAITNAYVTAQNAKAIASGISAVTSAFAPPTGNLATGILTSIALAAQVGATILSLTNSFGEIPTFYGGIEKVSDALGKPDIPGRDGYIVRVDADERIVDPETNKKLGGIKNKDLPDAVMFYNEHFPKFTVPDMETLTSRYVTDRPINSDVVKGLSAASDNKELAAQLKKTNEKLSQYMELQEKEQKKARRELQNLNRQFSRIETGIAKNVDRRNRMNRLSQ